MKILGVDYGSKLVGIASGDSVNKVSFPKCVIHNKGDDYVVEEILKICADEDYGCVVFGLPFDVDGGKGEQYNKVNRFIGLFEITVNDRGVGLCVDSVDEVFSSFEADVYLNDFKGKKMRKDIGDRDMMAAKVILDRYFTGLS